jgi:isopentenyldiphosphate isomerase
MIDPNELLFVVDENNKPLTPVQRHVVHEKSLWHRTTGIWVMNHKKQVLCQKRSMKKDIDPGLWETAFGGHVAPDETYLQNAQRELSEELGIKVLEENFIFYEILPQGQTVHKKFEALFAYEIDQEDTDFHIEKEEVDEIQWADLEEIKKILLEKNDPQWIHHPWDGEMLRWLGLLYKNEDYGL